MDQNRTGSFCCLGISLLILGLLASCATTVRANWIPNFPAEPGGNESPTNLDLTHWFLAVSYDGAGNFTVSSQYSGAGVLNNFDDPIYDIGPDTTLDIALSINPTTGEPISGSLTITGDATTYYVPSSSGTLLTGSISQFGFADPVDAANDAGAENFQFLFDTTGGDLAPWYPSIAVNLTLVDINFSGVFGSTPFLSDSGVPQTDTFAVPEPSSLLLLCLGTLVMTTKLGILRRSKVLRGKPRGTDWQDARRFDLPACGEHLEITTPRINHAIDSPLSIKLALSILLI